MKQFRQHPAEAIDWRDAGLIRMGQQIPDGRLKLGVRQALKTFRNRTGYFVLQGLAVAGERTRQGRRLGLGRGWRGWLFTVLVTAGPAFWLFPPPFVRNVILPMLAVIGAT